MPLPLIVDKIEAVPEAARGAYVERDGKFHLDFEIEDTATLKATLATEREKREAAEKLSKKVAEDLRKAETKAKAAEAGLTDEQLKKVRADIHAEIMAEVTPKLDEAAKVAEENRRLTFDDVGKKLAAEAGFLPTKLDDLWRLHGEDFELTADRKLMVKGKPGIEPAKHIEALKKLRPEWVQGTRGNGGGAAGFKTTPAAQPDAKVPPEQRMAAAFAAGATE